MKKFFSLKTCLWVMLVCGSMPVFYNLDKENWWLLAMNLVSVIYGTICFINDYDRKASQ